MKKVLLVLFVLALIAMPVFAETSWRIGVAGGYPQSGILGQLKIDDGTIELMATADYSPSFKSVGLGAQLYGTYDLELSDVFTLNLGAGGTGRIVPDWFIAPAARIGAEFNIANCSFVPFIRGDFGYAFNSDKTKDKFFWEAQAGISYKF